MSIGSKSLMDPISGGIVFISLCWLVSHRYPQTSTSAIDLDAPAFSTMYPDNGKSGVNPKTAFLFKVASGVFNNWKVVAGKKVKLYKNTMGASGCGSVVKEWDSAALLTLENKYLSFSLGSDVMENAAKYSIGIDAGLVSDEIGMTNLAVACSSWSFSTSCGNEQTLQGTTPSGRNGKVFSD